MKRPGNTRSLQLSIMWLENENFQKCHVDWMKRSGFSDLLIFTLAFNLFNKAICDWQNKAN